MTQGQRSYGSNGKQNMLFPLPFIYVSQGEGGDYSHQGLLAIDFIGWNTSGRVYECPYYAPCDLKLVAIFGSVSPLLIYESLEPVNFIDGTVNFICIGVAHDNETPHYEICRVVRQGQILGHTGTYGNVTGDHVHMQINIGQYEGMIRNSYGNYEFKNPYHIYNACGINGTFIVQGEGYNWRDFQQSSTIPRRTNFPWVLYSKKLRNRKN